MARGDLPQRVLVAPPHSIPGSMLVDYLKRRRSELAKLKATLGRHDFELARIQGHQMKGTGSAYGVPVVSKAGAAIERAAIRRDPVALGRAVASLDGYLSLIDVDPRT